jgi:hypothetical protein
MPTRIARSRIPSGPVFETLKHESLTFLLICTRITDHGETAWASLVNPSSILSLNGYQSIVRVLADSRSITNQAISLRLSHEARSGRIQSPMDVNSPNSFTLPIPCRYFAEAAIDP